MRMWMSRRAGTRAGVLCAIVAIGCATAGGRASTSVQRPLGAHLTADASTGAPIPLHIDPNAKVVRSTAPDLPPATYLPAQADRGEKVFNQVCAMCHARTQFIGQAFVENWNDHRVSDFYTLIRSTMPLSNPGGLQDEEYLGVVAYLLKENRAGIGVDSLGADSLYLRKHKIQGRVP